MRSFHLSLISKCSVAVHREILHSVNTTLVDDNAGNSAVCRIFDISRERKCAENYNK